MRDRSGVLGAAPESSDVLATLGDLRPDRSEAVGAFEGYGEKFDADLRASDAALLAALDADGADRLARDLPPGLITRITTASAAHLPSVPELLRLSATDAHAPAAHAGASSLSAAGPRRHADSPPHGRRERAFGASRLGVSIRSVLSMAAAIGLAFVAAMPFVTGPLTASRTPDSWRTEGRVALDQRGPGGSESTPSAIAASSRNESTLVMLLQDRRAGGVASSSTSTAASTAFANLRVFPISAEPTSDLTSLLDVRDTDVGALAEEFSRIQRATASGDGSRDP